MLLIVGGSSKVTSGQWPSRGASGPVTVPTQPRVSSQPHLNSHHCSPNPPSRCASTTTERDVLSSRTPVSPFPVCNLRRRVLSSFVWVTFVLGAGASCASTCKPAHIQRRRGRIYARPTGTQALASFVRQASIAPTLWGAVRFLGSFEGCDKSRDW